MSAANIDDRRRSRTGDSHHRKPSVVGRFKKGGKIGGEKWLLDDIRAELVKADEPAEAECTTGARVLGEKQD